MRTRWIALALVVSAAATGVVTAAERFPYIYKRGDAGHLRIRGGFDHVGTIARKYGGEFLWLRKSGRAYVIRDARTLAEVRAAFRDVDAMEPSLRAVERRLEPLERELEKIEERVDDLSDSLDDERLSEATRESIESRLRVAEDAMRAVERKIRPVNREMERLEHESERLEEIAEARLDEIVERAVARGIAERAGSAY